MPGHESISFFLRVYVSLFTTTSDTFTLVASTVVVAHILGLHDEPVVSAVAAARVRNNFFMYVLYTHILFVNIHGPPVSKRNLSPLFLF